MSERDPIPWPDDDALASQPELDEDAERVLGEALRSAWDPAAIDARRHAELLEQALIDPFAPPSAEEARESERLRRALEIGDDSHADVRLLRALSAAKGPIPRPAETNETARAALAKPARASKTNVVFVSFGAAALAAAAALVLVAGSLGAERAPSVARFVPSRSTTELFEKQFEQGAATERIDRIASARAHDLRENRYRMWGAR